MPTEWYSILYYILSPRENWHSKSINQISICKILLTAAFCSNILTGWGV